MYALGLHVDGPLLKAALLRREKGQVTVELLRTFMLEGKCCVKSLLASFLGEKKALIATGLDAWEVILRELEISLKRRREVLSVLPFQCEAEIPYPIEEAVIVPLLNPRGKEATQVTLLAVKKQHLANHLATLEERGIDPDWVSLSPVALWRYARSYLKRDSASLLYVGRKRSCCIAFSKERLLFSQTVAIGVAPFFNALAEDLPDKTLNEIDLFSLDPEETPRLWEVAERCKRERERLNAFFEQRGLPLNFSIVGDLPLSLHRFIEGEQREESGHYPGYALPIGLALDAIYQDRFSAQLRQGAFASSQKINRQVKNLSLYLLSVVFLSASLWGCGHYFLSKKEGALIKKIERYRGAEIKGGQKEMVSEVRKWARSLSGQKIPFPHQLPVPKSSDLLAWLSSHPLLNKEGISVKRVSYQLVKYPVLGKSTLPYQAKVELEFSSANPTLARDFHGSLLKGEGLVDASHEITWSARNQNYATSFILKEGYR